MKRIQISKKIRFDVFKRDSFKCQYCGAEPPDVILHVDHIQPVSKNGSNDLLNLITSCQSCNLGKRDIQLSDNSVFIKQKKMLNELNEKREQLEMLIKWRNELTKLKELEINSAADYWNNFIKGYSLNENGKKEISNWLRKNSLRDIFEAMDKANQFYLKIGEDGLATSESSDIAFNKITSLLNSKEAPDYLIRLFYIRGILRKRISYCDDQKAITKLKEALHYLTNGYKDEYIHDALDELKDLVFEAKSWSHFVSLINNVYR